MDIYFNDCPKKNPTHMCSLESTNFKPRTAAMNTALSIKDSFTYGKLDLRHDCWFSITLLHQPVNYLFFRNRTSIQNCD